jgi:hypothetical protein
MTSWPAGRPGPRALCAGGKPRPAERSDNSVHSLTETAIAHRLQSVIRQVETSASLDFILSYQYVDRVVASDPSPLQADNRTLAERREPNGCSAIAGGKDWPQKPPLFPIFVGKFGRN